MPEIPTTSSESNATIRTSDNQLFCCKSIDKLISDSEESRAAVEKNTRPGFPDCPRHRRGDWLGHFHRHRHGHRRTEVRYLLHPQRAAARLPDQAYCDTGRPGAGPALALLSLLVAIVCAFTALCYAELASMIPIAGSAYTYTYATMGELIAWIIGWDLILEYAVSNMAVSVGFAAHWLACSTGSDFILLCAGFRRPISRRALTI